MVLARTPTRSIVERRGPRGLPGPPGLAPPQTFRSQTVVLVPELVGDRPSPVIVYSSGRREEPLDTPRPIGFSPRPRGRLPRPLGSTSRSKRTPRDPPRFCRPTLPYPVGGPSKGSFPGDPVVPSKVPQATWKGPKTGWRTAGKREGAWTRGGVWPTVPTRSLVGGSNPSPERGVDGW